MPTKSINNLLLVSIKKINGTVMASLSKINNLALGLPNAVAVSNFTATDIGGAARVAWDTVTEQNVSYYAGERAPFGFPVFDPAFAIVADGSPNYFYDDIIDPGHYTYRIYAVYEDSSQSANPIPGAQASVVIA